MKTVPIEFTGSVKNERIMGVQVAFKIKKHHYILTKELPHYNGISCVKIYHPKQCQEEWLKFSEKSYSMIAANINSARKFYKELVNFGFSEST